MTVISLLILGFVLSLDNFRLAIALGAFRLSWRRALRIAVVFGLWDGFSPLVGLLIGRYFGEEIGEAADLLGPIVLLVFGLYLVIRSLQTEAPEDLDERMVLFGIPLSLSLDNLFAGTGLGMLGFPPVFSAAVFGSMTILMTFVGLQLGGVVARFIPLRSDLLSGAGLSIMAVVLVLGY
ncbi:MAG TPA: manganese efflux pump [Rubrobacteraceae bacterium]|jgi:putative Mn2+ efflux pump MntP|nr:manganese efflux pump [Rubrobacteraceae bacterium]